MSEKALKDLHDRAILALAEKWGESMEAAQERAHDDPNGTLELDRLLQEST